MSSSSSSSLSRGFVRLIPLDNDDFYLKIPLDIINSLCLHQRKYLIYLGWCILGVEGVLGVMGESEIGEIDNIGDLDDGETYHFLTNDKVIAAVDLKAIKARTRVPSETTARRDEFRTQLLERDLHCVWTGTDPILGEGMHIIPHRRGPEWLQIIMENRPADDEDDLAGLDDINDIRNGIFTSPLIHTLIDHRIVAILKTPNPILDTSDIPPRHNRNLPDDVGYPSTSRYTLQWLASLNNQSRDVAPNNSDAAFNECSGLNKPSALLLHYTYGATALKLWGHGLEALKELLHPRPSTPVKHAVGPSKGIHNRRVAIDKRNKAKAAEENLRNAAAGKASKVKRKDEGKATWDEDDVMLFFWGNSKAARARYAKTCEEKRQNMEEWRRGIESAPS